MFLMRDAASTAARLLSLVGSLLFGQAPCSGSCSALLISKGHTDCIGLSNCFPLCSKITPLATPSAPLTILITFPFFQRPRFFASPRISTISPTSGACASSRFTRWLSMRLWRYSLCHRLHACCLALFSRLWNLVSSSSSTSMSSRMCAPWPHMIRFGVKTWSSPLSLSTYVRGRLFMCFSMSITTASSCSSVSFVFPYVLYKVFLISLMSLSYIPPHHGFAECSTASRISPRSLVQQNTQDCICRFLLFIAVMHPFITINLTVLS